MKEYRRLTTVDDLLHILLFSHVAKNWSPLLMSGLNRRERRKQTPLQGEPTSYTLTQGILKTPKQLDIVQADDLDEQPIDSQDQLRASLTHMVNS